VDGFDDDVAVFAGSAKNADSFGDAVAKLGARDGAIPLASGKAVAVIFFLWSWATTSVSSPTACGKGYPKVVTVNKGSCLPYAKMDGRTRPAKP